MNHLTEVSKEYSATVGELIKDEKALIEATRANTQAILASN
jgi:hypothetical protein